jgi:MtN3 and saliva related transmembrane protein
LPELIGLAAGALTTASNLSPLLKSYRTKSTHDLSLPYLVVLFIGLALWTAYGFLINSLPVIVWNGVTLFIVGPLIFLKLKYG